MTFKVKSSDGIPSKFGTQAISNLSIGVDNKNASKVTFWVLGSWLLWQF